jgi:thymidylate kinase
LSAKSIICVSGADGSGKSTLVGELAKALSISSVVTIWDLMADPRARPIFSSKDQLQAFLGVLQPESRSLFLMSCLKAAMDRAPDGLILVDSYWYKYLANELALGADAVRLRGVSALFERPTLTFHLELAPVVAAARKQGTFSPYECGLRAPTAGNFVDFQSRTGPIVKQLIEGDCPKVITLDGTWSVAALLDRALPLAHSVLT